LEAKFNKHFGQIKYCNATFILCKIEVQQRELKLRTNVMHGLNLSLTRLLTAMALDPGKKTNQICNSL
jgi:hypothetical protein